MKWNLDEIEAKLNRASKELEDELEEELEDELEEDIDDMLYEILSDEEKNYHRVNKAYKDYISQYSKEYIEMSDYYYGPELPYHIYKREFCKHSEKGTYLDSPEEVKELYKLFIFYGLVELYFKSGHRY